MAAYGVDLTSEPQAHSSRWLAVLGIIGLKGLLLIPHVIALFVVGLIWGIVVWIGYWVVLFAGRMPDGLREFIAGYLRWSVRVSLWYAGTVDGYPPFSFRSGN